MSKTTCTPMSAANIADIFAPSSTLGGTISAESPPGLRVTYTSSPTPHYARPTKFLHAKARINKPSIMEEDKELVMRRVKDRLARQLLNGLMDSGILKITSDVSPSGSVTFKAVVEVIENA